MLRRPAENSQPVRAGLAIAWQLKKLFGSAFEIGLVSKMVRNADAAHALETADDAAKIADTWKAPLEGFEQVRRKYLLYE